ncbi:MAG: phosphatidylserine decarboxylase [bacterium]
MDLNHGVTVMMKFAPEGLPFIVVFAALTLICAVLLSFVIYFFRDPERVTPDRPDAFISPADGRILLVNEGVDVPGFSRPCTQISIFMSPFNVHVNRVPCDGTVVSVQYTAGRHLAAYREDSPRLNEKNEIVFSTAFGNLLIRQCAGFVARRTVCRATPGTHLRQGERFGIIKFSSRVDLYVPSEARVAVRKGDCVLAGETILAEMVKVKG